MTRMELFVQKEVGNRRIEGHCRKIEPTATRQETRGVEKIRYGYAEAGDRFLRPDIRYVMTVRSMPDGNGHMCSVSLGCIDWFSLSDGDGIYGEFLGKGRVAALRETFHPTDAELGELILRVNREIERCLQAFRSAYRNSDEYRATRENRERIRRWNAAKERFDREYGTGWFEQIYNFDLELMNVDLLEELRRGRGGGAGQDAEQGGPGHEKAADAAAGLPFSVQDISYLKKFYRLLARQYHPDISHDDGHAMQLLNRLKDFFGF